MEKKIFRSRISVVLMGLILAVFILASAPIFYYGANVAGIIIFAPTLLLAISILTGIRYTIVNNRLYLKTCGISSFNIKIADIVSVRRSYNPLSSPASSLKRLCLHLNKKSKWPHYCLVSPVREQEFLETLKSINPDIDIQVTEKQGKWRVWDWDM
jgi:hypothetical protein